MGMNACNIRILPISAEIEVTNSGWKIIGRSDITENDLVRGLVKSGVDIKMRDNIRAHSRKSYLINNGIEMLIGCVDLYVNIIEFRIGMSWVEEGLRECFKVIKKIETYVSVKDWVYNTRGEELLDEEEFLQRHLSFVSEKKEIFDKGYFEIRGKRLLESEILECYEKRNRKIFKFKPKRKYYKKIEVGV